MSGLFGIVISNCQKIFGSTNIGFFLFTLFNIVFGIMVLANTFRIMRDLKVPIIYRVICLGIYAIFPTFIGYIIINEKDTIYGLATVLLISTIIEIIHNEEEFWNKRRRWIMFILAGLLLILMRHNGLHLMIVLSIALLIKYIKLKKINIKRISIILTPIIVGEIIIQAITAYYNVIPGKKSEMHSFFVQQTARYVYFYKDEVTETEEEILSRTMAYYSIKDRYNPIISDRIKETFRDVSLDYIKVYIVQFIKHPNIYIDATLNMIYKLFVPSYVNTNYYQTFGSDYPGTRFEEPQIESLEQKRLDLYNYYRLYEVLPITNIMSGYGFYACLLITILIFLIRDNREKELYVYIPIIVTIIILILSPVVYFRYCLPIVFSTPVLLAHYLRKKDTE